MERTLKRTEKKVMALDWLSLAQKQSSIMTPPPFYAAEVKDLAKLYATAKLVKDMRIDVDDGRTHSICLDLPPDLGTDMGPTPLELTLMSYAGCIATIFALTAKKMRIPVKDLEVKAEGTKPEKEGTITKTKLDITVKADAPEDRIQRILKLTLQDCPVGVLFEKAGVKIDYSLKIQKE